MIGVMLWVVVLEYVFIGCWGGEEFVMVLLC